MLVNLLIGLLAMVLCLFLQLLLFIVAIRYYHRRDYLVNNSSVWSSLAVIKGVMLLLVIGNLAQMAIWAALFMLLGEFQQFEAAFYHSAVNFATLGYGDIVMSEQYKLLGPLEAVNGVLMIGVSTAALMAAFQDAMQKTLQARRE
ncbi:MAG: ion channel [Pseudomonadota bacterium]